MSRNGRGEEEVAGRRGGKVVSMDEMPPRAPSYPDGREHRAIQQRPRTFPRHLLEHVREVYRPAGAAGKQPGATQPTPPGCHSVPGCTACPLMAITRGTRSPRKINAGAEVPAIRRPPAHRRGTKTGRVRAGQWPIQWDRWRFQSPWFWKRLESRVLLQPTACWRSCVLARTRCSSRLLGCFHLLGFGNMCHLDHDHLPGRN